MDGDDDALEWPGWRTPPAKDPLPLKPPVPTVAGLSVLHDQVLDVVESERIPHQRRYFTVQLRTAALRCSRWPELVTHGPLDQEEPEGAVAAVADGAGRPWHRGADGIWHRTQRGRSGARSAVVPPGLPLRAPHTDRSEAEAPGPLTEPSAGPLPAPPEDGGRQYRGLRQADSQAGFSGAMPVPA